jgi:hypothetical protein
VLISGFSTMFYSESISEIFHSFYLHFTFVLFCYICYHGEASKIVQNALERDIDTLHVQVGEFLCLQV